MSAMSKLKMQLKHLERYARIARLEVFETAGAHDTFDVLWPVNAQSASPLHGNGSLFRNIRCL